MTLLGDLVRHDQPLSTGAYAVYPYSKALEKEYKFTPRFGDEVLLHEVSKDGKFIYLPRGLCPIGKKDERLEGLAVEFPKCPVPRPIQAEIFEETEKFLKAGQSGIVSAYTGWGKTVLGYKAAHVVGRKTLVITTKDDIYAEWLAGACGRPTQKNPNGVNFLGLTEADVGEIRADKCEVIGTKFCVAMIHSLSKNFGDKYPEWIADEFGLVIFDEVHRLPADQFSRCAAMFKAKLRLALSASVERSDGKEMLIHAHIGPVRAQTEAEELVPKVLRRRTGWQCPRVFGKPDKSGKKKVIRLPHEPGKTTHIEKMLAADTQRNMLICKDIKDAFDVGRHCVVFSTLIEHLQAMHRICVELGIPGKQIGHYGQASTKEDRANRDKLIARPVLFTTFGMMGEGTDIPWLDTAFLAIPRSKPVQPVGRIRRSHPEKRDPVVFDYIDADSPVFQGYAGSRMRWYESIGCKVVDED